MFIVDTTVWIDFFKNRDTDQIIPLLSAIQNQDDICICGVILTEILQGIRNPNEYTEVKDALKSLVMLPIYESTFVFAADIYRKLRKHGITVRKTIDCIIAAVALENKIPLLHNDKDFELIAKHFELKTIP